MRTSAFAVYASFVSGTLGMLALLLALLGLSGLLLELVIRRTQEIGVRMALGASRWSIVNMVVSEGLRPVLVGLLSGLAVAIVVALSATTVTAEAGEGAAWIPVIAITLLFVMVSGAACLIPAIRAASADPMKALRVN
jgi:ABC-type antimicrobial peptide transport system permease subunit